MTTDAEAVLAAGSAFLEAMKREPDLGTASIRDSTSQPLAIAQTYARLVHEIEGPGVLMITAQTLAGADHELRRIRSSLDQADEITELAASYMSAAIHVHRIAFEARAATVSDTAAPPPAPTRELVLRRLVGPTYVRALAPSISRTSLDQAMYCLERVAGLVVDATESGR